MTVTSSAPASEPEFDPRAWVTPEDLNLAPEVLGQPLATPRQRALAMGVDVALLAVLNGFLNALLVIAMGLGSWLWLKWKRPDLFSRAGLGLRRKLGATAGPSSEAITPGRPPRLAAWLLVAMFGVLGVMEMVDELRTGHKTAPAVEEQEEADEAVEEALKPLTNASSASGVSPEEAASATANAVAAIAQAVAEPASGAASASEVERRAKKQSRRIRQLEAELERAKAPRSLALMEEYRYWRDKFGFLILPALYFTLLPALWPGQTVGKRLFGLRILELTGKRLTPLILFKRYGGYAAGMATGFAGFLQLIWDPNRQAIQDKTAHTVVIDTRRPARTFVALADQAAPTEPAPALEAPKDSP
ncbi:RDD family protein [Paucibacter sp. Y2R2-4]|uniref:RDD family protein n=1 Tax=Paucibacter sp. Y2R2-4 TaxID=2893553 RepID=UPI0021E4BBA6|nr:RDD family protein [Paucibacter sp. Y2R2-4]MCV2350753.1 RDD family protein [Paucibacter sp. Y2R2-4]